MITKVRYEYARALCLCSYPVNECPWSATLVHDKLIHTNLGVLTIKFKNRILYVTLFANLEMWNR